MISAEEKLIRGKITGVLLRTARLRAKKSVDQCAAALGCDPAFIVRAEQGQDSLTLPQLESLADVLDVPLNCLLGEQELPVQPPLPQPLYLERKMLLRRKIIGVLLRQARQSNGHSLDAMAAQLGCEPDELAQIELGQKPLALIDLQTLAAALGLSLDDFFPEVDTPTETTAQAPALEADLAHLTPELRAFIEEPMNLAYLQIALNLSEMPADTLRRFASGLLEITY